MRMVRRFLVLRWSEKVLLGKAWALLFFGRTALWVCRFAWTKRRLDRWHAPVPRLVTSRRPAVRVARMVDIASHLVPAGRHCLSRAMILETLLRRRGYPARMEIGVALAAEEDHRGSRLSAHAWVTCGDRILLGGDEAPAFKSLTSPTP